MTKNPHTSPSGVFSQYLSDIVPENPQVLGGR